MSFKQFMLKEDTNVAELFKLDNTFLNDLGVFFEKDGDKQLVGLFKNSDNFRNGLSHFNNELSKESELNDLDKKALETINKEILGCAIIEKNHKEGCFQVKRIYADGSNEPFLYFILMELTSGLMPKSEGISEKAKNMWKNFYDGKYGDSIAKMLLKNSNYPGENHLNCKYALHQPFGATKLHQNCIDVVSSLKNNDKEEIRNNLTKLFKKALEKLNPISDEN
jgi:hypothetical protein